MAAYTIAVPADRVPTLLAEPVGPGYLTGVSALAKPDELIFPQTLYGTLALASDASAISSVRLTLASGYINATNPISWTGRLWLPPASFILLILQSQQATDVRLLAWTDTGPAGYSPKEVNLV